MKKKIFDKVLTVASAVIAVIFILVLLITVFGGFDTAVFDNSLVQGLFTALGVLYLIMTVGAIVYTFSDSDVIKDIIISSETGNNTRASAMVIKKLIKNNIKTVQKVKCQRISLIMTEYGVKLKIAIKVSGNEVEKTVVYLKCLLEDVFIKTIGYRFYAIDFKISSLKTDYVPNKTQIEEKANDEFQSLKNESEEKITEGDKQDSSEKIESKVE